MDKGSFKL